MTYFPISRNPALPKTKESSGLKVRHDNMENSLPLHLVCHLSPRSLITPKGSSIDFLVMDISKIILHLNKCFHQSILMQNYLT
jgi:hypothetical protein